MGGDVSRVHLYISTKESNKRESKQQERKTENNAENKGSQVKRPKGITSTRFGIPNKSTQ